MRSSSSEVEMPGVRRVGRNLPVVKIIAFSEDGRDLGITYLVLSRSSKRLLARHPRTAPRRERHNQYGAFV